MKLNYKRTLLVGLAFLSICAFWQLYDNVVPLILKNTFDIPDDIAGVIMALDNVLALFLLPLAVCLVLALVFRKKLAARRERDPIDPKWRRLFFRTPGWIIFLVLSCVCIILNFFVLGA